MNLKFDDQDRVSRSVQSYGRRFVATSFWSANSMRDFTFGKTGAKNSCEGAVRSPASRLRARLGVREDSAQEEYLWYSRRACEAPKKGVFTYSKGLGGGLSFCCLQRVTTRYLVLCFTQLLPTCWYLVSYLR